jgi:hypothetical protein
VCLLTHIIQGMSQNWHISQVESRISRTSPKCNYVTGSLSECLRVVRLDSQRGPIPKLTRPMQWYSGAPGSTCQRRRQPWEHLCAPMTCLGAPVTGLGAPHITVEQSGKNNILGNTTGVPGNHSSTYRSTILKTQVFGLYSHQCICVSI